MNYTAAKEHAIGFLISFVRSDFEDMSLYAKFKTYRMMHNKGTLTKGSYECVLQHIGYAKQETWSEYIK